MIRVRDHCVFCKHDGNIFFDIQVKFASGVRIMTVAKEFLL